jgi:hypothetical protein
MRVTERFRAWGHPNITAKNRVTFELTKEESLSPRGDCVVAVRAEKGAAELRPEFKALAMRDGATIMVRLKVGGIEAAATGYGSPNLTFTHPTDLVGRKSSFTCGRTLMIKADKAAIDFPRELVQVLKNPLTAVDVMLTVEL